MHPPIFSKCNKATKQQSNKRFFLPSSPFGDVADEEGCEGEAADGGDVYQGAVGSFFSFGGLYFVLQDFFAIDALEFLPREGLGFAETAAKGCGKGTAADFPEFGCGDA